MILELHTCIDLAKNKTFLLRFSSKKNLVISNWIKYPRNEKIIKPTCPNRIVSLNISFQYQ